MERPGWWPEALLIPDSDATLPRIETPHHPRAVGTYGLDVIQFAKRELGITLRWWQRLVLCRMLEHDADGLLVWREVGISTPRQVGKSWILRVIAMWRIHQEGLFGEKQTVLSIANALSVAQEVFDPALPWARANGHYTRLANGEKEIAVAGNRWIPRSSKTGYGFSLSTAMADECWDLEPSVVSTMLVPTLIERHCPQLVLFSTAHPKATMLFPKFRVAGGHENDRLVLEWSAPKGADHREPKVWRAASPHWSEQRQRMMSTQLDTADVEHFRSQYLNQWVDLDDNRRTLAFPGWTDMPTVTDRDPLPGCTVAVDESFDGSHCGVVAFADRQVWYREYPSLAEALTEALSWQPEDFLIGFSLRSTQEVTSRLEYVTPYGAKETAMALPLMLESVKRGTFAHEHSEILDAQAAGAMLVTTDLGGLRLSVKNSTASVLGLKLIAWVLLFERYRAEEEPGIFF